MKKSNDTVFDGVCAGISEHLGIDPLWLRIAFVWFGLFWLYIILMLIMDEPGSDE